MTLILRSNATSSAKPRLWMELRGRGPLVVFLHGFTQAGQSWEPVLREVKLGSCTVGLLDLPGHGKSSQVQADLEASADLVASICGPAIYVGYSMGGRLALHLALRHPNAVRGLLLFGATPGLPTEEERARRRADDEELAQSLEAFGVPLFLEKWLTNSLFATLPDDPADRALRARNTAAGLASSLRLSGTGSQKPLWTMLHTIGVPTIIAAGDRDEKFTAIGNTMAQEIGPNATFESITNAGHPCHLERPTQGAALLHHLLDLSG